ncbi:glycosyltransferase [Aquabacterium soli]|nr:glycosyltransferase [Aquabacterium soli]
MKVLHIISGLAQGGAETVLCRLVESMPEQEHLVAVLSTLDQLEGRLRQAGAQITYIDLRTPWRLPLGLIELWRFIRRTRPDVVQTWMYHADVVGGVCARLAGAAPVCWGLHHASPSAPDLGLTARLSAKLGKMLSGWIPASIIACSNTTSRCHAAFGYRPAAIRVICNGYDTEVFRPDPSRGRSVRRRLRIDDGARLIGMVARFHPAKDHANLFQALALLRQRRPSGWRCLLVGDGMNHAHPDVARLLASSHLADEVVLAGPQADMPAIMNALDVLVLSSATEAFPNVLNEAMACGVPCVSTDVGDASLIVGDTGWTVPAKNPAALADALATALQASESAPDWELRCQAARQRIVDNFSAAAMAEGYRQCWMLASHGRLEVAG